MIPWDKITRFPCSVTGSINTKSYSRGPTGLNPTPATPPAHTSPHLIHPQYSFQPSSPATSKSAWLGQMTYSHNWQGGCPNALYLGNYWALWSSVWKSTFTFLGPLLFSSSSANSVWNLIHIKIQCYSPPKGKPRCRGYLDGHHTPFFWSHS